MDDYIGLDVSLKETAISVGVPASGSGSPLNSTCDPRGLAPLCDIYVSGPMDRRPEWWDSRFAPDPLLHGGAEGPGPGIWPNAQ